MEPAEAKSLGVVAMMKSIFTTLRLTPVDDQLILAITKKIKGFSRKMLAWYFIRNVVDDNSIMTEETRINLFTQEKRLLAKDFAKLSLDEKLASFRLSTVFFLKQKGEASPIEAEPEFQDFFRNEIFLKRNKEWHSRQFSAQADHKYVDELLQHADAEVFAELEQHYEFYFQSPTLLGHLLKRVYDFNESPQEHFNQVQHDRLVAIIDRYLADLYEVGSSIPRADMLRLKTANAVVALKASKVKCNDHVVDFLA